MTPEQLAWLRSRVSAALQSELRCLTRLGERVAASPRRSASGCRRFALLHVRGTGVKAKPPLTAFLQVRGGFAMVGLTGFEPATP